MERTKLSRNPINELELLGVDNQNTGEGSKSVSPIQLLVLRSVWVK